MAFIALLLITQVNTGLPGPLWPQIVVGVTAGILMMDAKIEALSIIPVTVCGYARRAGYGLLSGASLSIVDLANLPTKKAVVIGKRRRL